MHVQYLALIKHLDYYKNLKLKFIYTLFLNNKIYYYNNQGS